MALLTDSLLVDILLGAVSLLGLVYYYLTATYDYWKKRGVPYKTPEILFGNLKDLLLKRKHMLNHNQDIYNSFPQEKLLGYYEIRRPVMMIRDPEIAQHILIKDFSYFTNRGMEMESKIEPLTENLLNMKDDEWRHARNKLTPTFTTGKLKGMIKQMCNCGEEVLKEIEKHISNEEPVEAKVLGQLFSLDVIASCAFGLQFKPDSAEGVQFRRMVDLVLSPSWSWHLMFTFLFPKVAKLLKIRQFPEEVSNYFVNLVRSTVNYRKKNNIERNDFLQLMMNLKDREELGTDKEWKSSLSEEDSYLNQLDDTQSVQNGTDKAMADLNIVAQSFIFLFAGSEVVASSVAFTLHELAINPEVQRKLQQEVDSTLSKHGGKVIYESLKDMTYLDMIIQEKNRKYSEAGTLFRECAAPYRIPGTQVFLEKGTKVIIPMHAIHNDPQYYPEPDKLIPERFEGNGHRNSGTYMPFGDGPRMCIAMRFALLEQKVCIAQIMSRYTVTLDPKTQVPLRLDPASPGIRPIGGNWVRFQKRQETTSTIS